MAANIDITLRQRSVGSWTFDEAPKELKARRTADGAIITLPSMLRLDWSDDALPYVTNLRATVETEDGIELGLATYDYSYMASDPYGQYVIDLQWRLSFQALALFEQKRDGKPPVFILQCAAEVSHIMYSQAGRRGSQLHDAPPSFIRRRLRLGYPRDVWVHMLRELKISENVVIEIPIPAARPEPWDGVLNALLESRRCLDQGGTTGWKGAVMSLRHALEKWQAIEKEDMGPGWKKPPLEDLQARTKEQRLDNLRWHVFQVAHLAAHSPADGWTRDDALALFSMVASLLALRRP